MYKIIIYYTNHNAHVGNIFLRRLFNAAFANKSRDRLLNIKINNFLKI